MRYDSFIRNQISLNQTNMSIPNSIFLSTYKVAKSFQVFKLKIAKDPKIGFHV